MYITITQQKLAPKFLWPTPVFPRIQVVNLPCSPDPFQNNKQFQDQIKKAEIFRCCGKQTHCAHQF